MFQIGGELYVRIFEGASCSSGCGGTIKERKILGTGVIRGMHLLRPTGFGAYGVYFKTGPLID
jgi:hypothetical protein